MFARPADERLEDMSDTRLTPEQAASKLEIIDLFARYCHAVDSCEFSLFENLFTEDLVADYSTVRGDGEEPLIHGRSALVDWLTEAIRPIGRGMTHFMTNHLVTFDGDEADIISHNSVLNVAMGGVYYSHAVQSSVGWRLSRIRFEVRYFAEIADLLNGTLAAQGS
jgi:hypothetical protein